ncbi:MAG: CDGSH iron-sulfur domain-containing protein [Kofleriaceae bacterium]
MAKEVVKGTALTIHFDGAKCIHSRGCVLNHPEVFRPNVEGEWISPDAASVAAVVEVAHNCPSGAISYQRHDGGPAEAPPVVNLVTVRENGPLAVHAACTIAGHGDALRATLCRCGASANKPFCDGSHVAAGFVATGEPATAASSPLEARGGALQIQPAPDGPLLVTGNLELVSGTGRTLNRVTKAALCRCGQSQNKPYCDGSHRAAGFKAD